MTLPNAWSANGTRRRAQAGELRLPDHLARAFPRGNRGSVRVRRVLKDDELGDDRAVSVTLIASLVALLNQLLLGGCLVVHDPPYDGIPRPLGRLNARRV